MQPSLIQLSAKFSSINVEQRMLAGEQKATEIPL